MISRSALVVATAALGLLIGVAGCPNTPGKQTNIAKDKDKMVGEAVWREHVRSTGGKRRSTAKLKIKRH